MGKAITGGSVNVYDLDESRSPILTATRTGRGARREVELAYADAEALMNECLPTAGSPGKYPGSTTLYVESVEIKPKPEPVPASGDVPTGFTGAFATIVYAPLQNDGSNQDPEQSNPETLISRRWSISAEFMTIGSDGLEWSVPVAGQNKAGDRISAGKLLPQIVHAITLHRSPTIPWTTIRECIGKVNDGLLNDDVWDNVAEETLLFLGAEISYTSNTDGSESWTIDFQFHERTIEGELAAGGVGAITWNHFFNAESGKWDRLVTKNGDYIYSDTADFPTLFT